MQLKPMSIICVVDMLRNVSMSEFLAEKNYFEQEILGDKIKLYII